MHLQMVREEPRVFHQQNGYATKIDVVIHDHRRIGYTIA